MVEEIYKLKNKILTHVEDRTRDMNRIDVKEVGELVDMVKDLAEAEEKCWEAAYYRSVTNAMKDSSERGKKEMVTEPVRPGYETQMRQGYSQDESNYDDIIGQIGDHYRNLTPNERTVMKNKIFSALGSA